MKETITYSGAALVLMTLAITGCSSTEGDMLDTISSDEGELTLCVEPQLLGVDFVKSTNGTKYFAKAGDFSYFSESSEFDVLPALQKAGYASATAESLGTGPFGSRSKDAYRATDKITPYINDSDDLCLGTKTPTEIIEYTEMAEQGQQMTQADFKYEIDFNDLVDELNIEDQLVPGPVQKKFPGTGTAVLTKTNKGWRLEYATWSGSR